MASSEESSKESESDIKSLSEDEIFEVEDMVFESNIPEGVDSMQPYADEPFADDEWITNYRREKEEKAKLENSLKRRLENKLRLGDWCSCGKCSCELLSNINECYCCHEIEGCMDCLESDIVMEDLEDGQKPNCITEHPGFSQVCLAKWSLRLSGQKFRTRTKQIYKKTGSEERYLRSVAYREFTRLVHGFIGKKRIPLPACAYTAIRKAFPSGEDEPVEGFQLDD